MEAEVEEYSKNETKLRKFFKFSGLTLKVLFSDFLCWGVYYASLFRKNWSRVARPSQYTSNKLTLQCCTNLHMNTVNFQPAFAFLQKMNKIVI